MSTHMPGFQSFFNFLPHIVSANLATSSIKVKEVTPLNACAPLLFPFTHLFLSLSYTLLSLCALCLSSPPPSPRPHPLVSFTKYASVISQRFGIISWLGFCLVLI